MISEMQLRETLANFLSGKLDREEFEDSFVRNTWNIHQNPDLGAQRITSAVELLLAENNSGHLSDSDLRKELEVLVSFYLVLNPNPVSNVLITSNASSGTFTQQSATFLVDMRFSKASL
jgi:hypothetical protein